MALRLWHRFAALPAGLAGGGLGFVLWLMLLPRVVDFIPDPALPSLTYPPMLAMTMGLGALAYAALLGWFAGEPRIRLGAVGLVALLAAALAYLWMTKAAMSGLSTDQRIVTAAALCGLVAVLTAPTLIAPRRAEGRSA